MSKNDMERNQVANLNLFTTPSPILVNKPGAFSPQNTFGFRVDRAYLALSMIQKFIFD